MPGLVAGCFTEYSNRLRAELREKKQYSQKQMQMKRKVRSKKEEDENRYLVEGGEPYRVRRLSSGQTDIKNVCESACVGLNLGHGFNVKYEGLNLGGKNSQQQLKQMKK